MVSLALICTRMREAIITQTRNTGKVRRTPTKQKVGGALQATLVSKDFKRVMFMISKILTEYTPYHVRKAEMLLNN
jgi:hypothetical protein